MPSAKADFQAVGSRSFAVPGSKPFCKSLQRKAHQRFTWGTKGEEPSLGETIASVTTVCLFGAFMSSATITRVAQE